MRRSSYEAAAVRYVFNYAMATDKEVHLLRMGGTGGKAVLVQNLPPALGSPELHDLCEAFGQVSLGMIFFFFTIFLLLLQYVGETYPLDLYFNLFYYFFYTFKLSISMQCNQA